MVLTDPLDFRRWVRWLRSAPRFLGSVSPFSLLVALRSARRFCHLASETNRSLSEVWGSVLPSVSAAQLLGGERRTAVTIDETKRSIGLEELVPLLMLVRGIPALQVFEIGTSTGGTTWHIAANLVPQGKVYTLDLPPETSLSEEFAPQAIATSRPSAEQLGVCFRGSDESHRVIQLLGDSGSFEAKDLSGRMDLVFVDGAHTYESVRRDTRLAFQLAKPGGYVCWHDYFVFHPDYGVRRYLHEGIFGTKVFRLAHSLSAVARVPLVGAEGETSRDRTTSGA